MLTPDKAAASCVGTAHSDVGAPSSSHLRPLKMLPSDVNRLATVQPSGSDVAPSLRPANCPSVGWSVGTDVLRRRRLRESVGERVLPVSLGEPCHATGSAAGPEPGPLARPHAVFSPRHSPLALTLTPSHPVPSALLSFSRFSRFSPPSFSSRSHSLLSLLSLSSLSSLSPLALLFLLFLSLLSLSLLFLFLSLPSPPQHNTLPRDPTRQHQLDRDRRRTPRDTHKMLSMQHVSGHAMA
ncbi:hypothetical protein BDW22DRAFT_1433700 [Trametopsis cervina]|nr:hypothetical protein BDW22DRAFT_1433700 [Trametopsis cervina]